MRLGTNILEEEPAISIFRLRYLPTELGGVTFYNSCYQNLAVRDHLMWGWVGGRKKLFPMKVMYESNM